MSINHTFLVQYSVLGTFAYHYRVNKLQTTLLYPLHFITVDYLLFISGYIIHQLLIKCIIFIHIPMTTPTDDDDSTSAPTIGQFHDKKHTNYITTLGDKLDSPTSYEGAVTEHLRMSGVYWSLG